MVGEVVTQLAPSQVNKSPLDGGVVVVSTSVKLSIPEFKLKTLAPDRANPVPAEYSSFKEDKSTVPPLVKDKMFVPVLKDRACASVLSK